MKLMFISDIHGMKTNLEKIRERYQELQCDKLIVLGDLYYIGPMNRLNKDYDITAVREFLESFKEELICLRGNCDSDIDIETSHFPIINELGLITVGDQEIYLTHGHIYNEENWEKENSILVYGHYHIPFIRERNNSLFINPGSISLPKENYPPSYLIYDGEQFTIYDCENHELMSKKIK